MRKFGFVGAGLVAVSLTLAACGTDSTGASASASAPTSAPVAAANSQAGSKTGTFTGLNEKKVSGSALVNATGITLSGFSADEGPDLHIYLTNGTDEAAVAAGKQIGKVQFDQKSQQFALTGVDVSAYSTVVIHCDKAKAVFGAAKLS